MKIFRLILLFFFSLSIYLYIYQGDKSSYIDNKLYDFFYSLNKKYNTVKKGNHVVVIDIDEKSLKYLGQWPWSRVILTQLMSEINKQHPSSIGIDILFAEPDKTSPKSFIDFYKKYFNFFIDISGLNQELMDNDKLLAEEFSRGNVSLPVYLTEDKTSAKKCLLPEIKQFEIDIKKSYPYLLCNIEKLQKSAASVGFINSKVDEDGKLRRVPLFLKYKERVLPSLGLAMMMNLDKEASAKAKKVSVLGHTFSVNEDYEVLLKFEESYSVISAIDLLMQNIKEDALRGKFVLLGASAVGLHDLYRVVDNYSFPGVFVHATLINNILNDETAYQPKIFKNINLLISLLISLFLVYMMFKKAYFKTVVLFVFFNIAFFVVSYVLLKNGIYISSAYFLFPLWVNFFFINLFFIFLYYEERAAFNKTLTKAHTSVIDSMALVAETRDAETGAHIRRTKEYMKCLSEYLYARHRYADILDKNYMELLYRATPLHDIGKVGIPDSILKKEGSLSKEEYEVMKTHSVLGKNIIENAMKNAGENEFLKIAYNIAYYHHEKWDGTGYPKGLKAKEIPLEARMMALCDVYDALISRRCYKIPISFEKSAEIIIDGSGTHFDPVLVDVFIKIRDKFEEIAKKIQS